MSQLQDDIDSLLAQAEALAEAQPAPPPAVPDSAVSAVEDDVVHEDPRRILRLQVPVIVRLAERTMPLCDIVSLSTGAIIEFEKPADADLDLMINNKCIGQGNAVKVGENFGLRVTTIGSVVDRIQALAGK